MSNGYIDLNEKGAELWRRLAPGERGLRRLRLGLALLLIVLLAQAAAKLTWALLSAAPAPPPEISQPSAPRPREAGGGAPAADAAALGERLARPHLFGQSEAQAVAVAETAAMIDAPETTLGLELKGVAAASAAKGRGLAVIAEKSRAGSEDVYGIGDTVRGDAVLEVILVDRVLLRRAGLLEALFLKDMATKNGSTPGRSLLRAKQVSRQFVDRTFANLPVLAKQVEVHIHNPQDGRPGFRLVSPGGSEFLDTIGLQADDILYEINGIALTDPGAALTAFEQLREARNLRLVFERGGAERTLSVAIR